MATPESAPASSVWLWRLGLAVLVCGLVVFAYFPAVHGGFIWDDHVLLADSPLIKAADGLYRFWFTTEAPDYWPLTSTTFWVEWRLWGGNTTGYHVTNVALHAIEALLLWAILLKMRIGGAYLAALVFAVHPVNVESVAWIAQRKNLVGMLFVLLAAIFYLAADGEDVEARRRGGTRRLGRSYWLSLAMFLLALLGKGSVATLPVLFLLLAWWQRRRVTARDLLRVAPFALLAGAVVLVNIWFQTHGGSEPIRTATLGERLLGAGGVVWFYLTKALLPVRLAFVYPQWHVDVGNPLWWLPLLAALGVSVALYRLRHAWGRPFFAAWAFFCVALLPVLGLTDVYFMTYSLVADHYQHLAMVGVIALVTAGWSEWRRRVQGPGRLIAVAVAAAIVATLTWMTFRQSAIYQDEETLYRATTRANPDAWLAHYNLAVILKAQGRRQEEIVHLEETVRVRPEHGKAHGNLALALSDQGRAREALDHAQQAVRLQPAMLEPLVNLGIVLARSGRPADALAPLDRAVLLRPGSAEAHYNLGITLSALGRTPEALLHFREASRLEPDSSADHDALAGALTTAGRLDEAVAELEQSLRLKPGDAAAHARLAQALLRAGRRQDAVARYEDALRLSPNDATAPQSHYNLGVLLTSLGRKDEGRAHYASALELKPDFVEAHYNVAAALLAEGRNAEAIVHLEEVVRSRPDLLVARLNLADTYARTGRLSEAVAQAQAALAMAEPTNRTALEAKIRAWKVRLRTGGS